MTDEPGRPRYIAKPYGNMGPLCSDPDCRGGAVIRVGTDWPWLCEDHHLSWLEEKYDEQRELLQRIHAWDHMDSASDGKFWRREIDAVLSNFSPVTK